MIKARWEISSGLLGKESGWDIDTMPIADFGNVNLAAAGTVRSGFNYFPLVNPAHIIKSPDNMPFENPGGTLAAASGDRQIGSSTQPMALLVGAYLVHVTAAGAVYQPAGTTVNVRVVNSVNAVAGALTTLATINAATAANFADVMPIVAPAGRTFSPEGLPNAAAATIYNGDALFAEIVTTGALNVQGNILYIMLEIC